MAALGIGAGDEVIVADTGWIASVAPIVHLGATPVFVDILPDTWCIDPAAAARAVGPRTRAVLAVHLYGNTCDMDALLDLADRHGIAVIEDAAEAIGSEIGGRRAGSMGRIAAFSFHGTKTITTGEGGALVTDDEALHERALTLSNHGRARGQRRQFWPDMLGYKFKMSNMQAALGRAQLSRVGELVDRKRAILGAYRSRLLRLPGVSMNPEPPGTVNGAWMPTVVVDRSLGVTRERMQAGFAEENIDARVFFHPLSGLPMFEPVHGNVNAWDIPQRAINLPSFHDISDDEIDRVCRVIERCVHG
jgi:perosamine synthetase